MNLGNVIIMNSPPPKKNTAGFRDLSKFHTVSLVFHPTEVYKFHILWNLTQHRIGFRIWQQMWTLGLTFPYIFSVLWLGKRERVTKKSLNFSSSVLWAMKKRWIHSSVFGKVSVDGLDCAVRMPQGIATCRSSQAWKSANMSWHTEFKSMYRYLTIYQNS